MCIVKRCLERPEIKVLMELLRKSDSEAFVHSCSVAHLTEQMLNKCKKFEDKKESIIIGALLHDIGKIFVPFNLTQFPEALSNNERRIVKVHPAVSCEIVAPVFDNVVKDICFLHHERIDGSGYCESYNMSNIPEYVLLVQTADIYDALTSTRPYKVSYLHEKAIGIMKKETKELKADDYYLKLLEDVVEDEKQGGTCDEINKLQ